MARQEKETVYRPIPDADVLGRIEAVIDQYKGDLRELETAIGIFHVGRRFGWRPLYLMNDRKTLKKCEAIFGIDLREVLQEVGPKADKSVAWSVYDKAKSFWRTVRGDYPGVKSLEIDHAQEE